LECLSAVPKEPGLAHSHEREHQEHACKQRHLVEYLGAAHKQQDAAAGDDGGKREEV
jgi:hypothetical protein